MKKKILTCKRGLIICLVLTVSGILVGLGAFGCMMDELSEMLRLGLRDLLELEPPNPPICDIDHDDAWLLRGLTIVDAYDAEDVVAAAIVCGVSLLGALLSGLAALVLSFFVGNKPAEVPKS